MGRRALGATRSMTVAVAAVAVLVAGCGDDSPSSTPADPPSASDTSPSEASLTPELTTTPDTAAATGPLLDGKAATIRAPEGFRMDESLVRWMHTASDPDGFSSVTLAVTPGAGVLTLDQLADMALRRSMPKGSRQLADVTLDGVDFYRLAGAHPDGLYVEEYAAELSETVSIVINVDYNLDKTQRRELIESVLASFRWS